MSDVFGIRGLLTLDIGQAMANLDRVQARIERFVFAADNLFQRIDAAGLTKDFVTLGAQVGTFALASNVMVTSFTQGFSQIRQAGGEAFDYIGSRAEELGKKAIMAGSEFENFRRTIGVFLKDTKLVDEVTKKISDYEVTSPFEMKDVMRASRGIIAKGVKDPDQILRWTKLAGEMAAVSDQPITLASEAIRKMMARSPEAYRSLKTNFQVGPTELQANGVTLDPTGRLRMRTQNDADTVLAAVEKYYQKLTQMHAAEQQAQTVLGKWSSAQSEVFRTLAGYSDIIAPKVKYLIDQFKDMVHWLGELSPTTKDTISNFVLYAAGAFALKTALSPVVGILGDLTGGFVKVAFGIGSMGIALVALQQIVTGKLFTQGISNLVDFLRNYTVAQTIQTTKAVTTQVATGLLGANGLPLMKSITANQVVSQTAQVAVPGAATAATAVEGAGAKITMIGTRVGEVFTKLMGFGTELVGALSNPLVAAAFAAEFLANQVIKGQEAISKQQGKMLEDASKVDAAQKSIRIQQQFNAMSPEDQANFLKNDPDFLSRQKKNLTLLSQKGSQYNTNGPVGSLDFAAPTVAAQGPQLPGTVSFGGDVPSLDVKGGLADTRGASDLYNSIKGNNSDQMQASLLLSGMQGAGGGGNAKLTTEEIREQQRTYQEQQKLGYLSKLDYFNKEKSILKEMVDSEATSDDIRKQQVAVTSASIAYLNQRMYAEIDVARNKDIANEELSLEKKKNYNLRQTSIIEANTMDRFDYNKQFNKLKKAMPSEFAASLSDIAAKQRSDALDFNENQLPFQILKGKRLRTDDESKQLRTNAAERSGFNLAQEREDSKFKAQGLTNTGNTLGAGLESAAQKYRDEIRQFQDNKARMKVIEAQHNLEVKKLYLEDFITWRTIQQQKIDFDVKMKANQKQRELDLMQASRSLTGERNLSSQNKKVEEIAADQIKAIQDRAAKEQEILEKAIRSTVGPEQARKREELRESKKNAQDQVDAIKQGTLITTAGNDKTDKGESIDAATQAADIELRKANYKQTILDKKMAKAKTPEDLDKYARKNEEIIKTEYQSEKDILDLQEKKELLGKEGDPAAQARIKNDFALKQLELQEKYVQKLEDATTEMLKQKALLEGAANEKGRFTMGNIYSSYEEISKHDDEDAAIFAQRQNQDGGLTDQQARSRAQTVLGIPGSSPTDIFNSPVLAKNKVSADKWAGGYPTVVSDGQGYNPGNFKADHGDIVIVINGEEKARRPINDSRTQSSNPRVPMGQ